MPARSTALPSVSQGAGRLALVADAIEACRPEVLNGALVPAEDCRLMIAAVEADLENRANPEQAVEIARDLLGAFGRIEAHDPDRFVQAIAATICNFPLSIARELADPVRGLPSQQKRAPNSPAEVRDWCERLLQARKQLKWKAIAIQKERQRREKLAAEDAVFSREMTPEELQRRKSIAALARDRLAAKIKGDHLGQD